MHVTIAVSIVLCSQFGYYFDRLFNRQLVTCRLLQQFLCSQPGVPKIIGGDLGDRRGRSPQSVRWIGRSCLSPQYFVNINVLIESYVASTAKWRSWSICFVSPASSAAAERSFSAIQRLKTWLCSIMTQLHLHSLAVCRVHQELSDLVDVMR